VYDKQPTLSGKETNSNLPCSYAQWEYRGWYTSVHSPALVLSDTYTTPCINYNDETPQHITNHRSRSYALSVHNNQPIKTSVKSVLNTTDNCLSVVLRFNLCFGNTGYGCPGCTEQEIWANAHVMHESLQQFRFSSLAKNWSVHAKLIHKYQILYLDRIADSEHLVILACTVFDWSTHVRDGRTDRQTELRWLRCNESSSCFCA